MSVVPISLTQARNMVIQSMRDRQLRMSKAGQQIKTFWGNWNNTPIYLSIGEAISEVENSTELGQFILIVELNGIAQQTGVTYELTG